MSEEQQGEAEKVGERSGLTRKQQIEALMPVLRKVMPSLVTVGAAYNKAYPYATTSPDVLDAVTVAVPLRQFMVMTGVCSVLVAEHIEAGVPA